MKTDIRGHQTTPTREIRVMVDTNDPSVPTIHMNGTNRAVLLHDYLTAHNAIHLALKAVGNTSPHERDYYVKGRDAIVKAMREHRSRMRRLHDIEAELAAIAIALGC